MANLIKEVQTEFDRERKLVDVDNFDLSVREVFNMIAKGEIKLIPEYQRKFRWDAERESKLIESLLINLPIPSIYVAANADGTWEVIDGLQRLSTLVHFFAEKKTELEIIKKSENLVITGLTKLKSINDLKYKDFPQTIQLHLGKRYLRITVISDKSDVDIRYVMFERLNTGGIELTPQEVRECVFRGPSIEYIKKLSKNETFRKLLKLQKSHQDDGTYEEQVLKYFAYKNNSKAFDGDVKTFLNNYVKKDMAKINMKSEEILFNKVVKSLYDNLNRPIIREGYGVTPLNQFEAILVGAAKAISKNGKLKKPKENWLNDPELIKFSTKGTNTRNFLNGRISRAYTIFGGE